MVHLLPSRRAVALAFGGLLLAVLSACTNPPVARGDLLQQFDAALRQAQNGRGLSLTLVPDRVVTGQEVAIQVLAPQPGYLYLFQLGTDGQSINQIFPNALDPNNAIAAGETLLPRQGWRFSARGPAGVGYVLAVLAQIPQDQASMQAKLAYGHLDLMGPYQASLVTLTERAP